MKSLRLIALLTIITFTACKPGVKKQVLIIAKGDISAEGNNITLKGSSGASDKTIELSDETSLEVTTPNGKSSMSIPAESGFYIANLRADTLVGSQQMIGTSLSGRTILQEELKGMIDSLNLLLTGANVKAENHNYMVLPNKSIKVSANPKAKVYGPFTKIPGTMDADENGKAPEIYKFYTNNEMREVIANLIKQTI